MVMGALVPGKAEMEAAAEDISRGMKPAEVEACGGMCVVDKATPVDHGGLRLLGAI